MIDDRQRHARKYSEAASRVSRRVERRALGHEVGLAGYTTIDQARILTSHVGAGPASALLDLGAGRGWPGAEVARSSGCLLVSTDVPMDALAAARSHVNEAGFGNRHEVVVADGCSLPFRSESFDAIVHADVFC